MKYIDVAIASVNSVSVNDIVKALLTYLLYSLFTVQNWLRPHFEWGLTTGLTLLVLLLLPTTYPLTQGVE